MELADNGETANNVPKRVEFFFYLNPSIRVNQRGVECRCWTKVEGNGVREESEQRTFFQNSFKSCPKYDNPDGT